MPNKAPMVPVRAASMAKIRTAQVALTQSVKNLDSSGGTSKRLTFVPMSAWVNNADEDEATMKVGGGTSERIDKQLTGHPKELSPAGDPSSKRGVRWPLSNVEVASVISVSTCEQQFSVDGQSISCSSSSVTKVETEEVSPLITQAPHPTQTSSASSSISSIKSLLPPLRPPSPPPPPPPPRSPPPTQLRPPTAPLRTVSDGGSRRVLRHPSDVAALLHEVLKGSSGLSAAENKVSGSQGLKAKKVNGDVVPRSAQDSGVLDTLARIITDRMTSGDQRKDSRKSKLKQANLLTQLDVNRALLTTGESNCNGDGNIDSIGASGLRKKHGKFHSSRQQNCNNCYEKPVKKVRYLNHDVHISDLPSHSSLCQRKRTGLNDIIVEQQEVHSNRLKDMELLTENLQASEQQLSLDPQQRRQSSARDPMNSKTPVSSLMSLKNWSNSTHRISPKSSNLFFELAGSHSSNRNATKKYDTAQPLMSSATDGRQIQRRSPNCCGAADNDSTNGHSSDWAITTNTGSGSTEDAMFVQWNGSLTNIQAGSRQYPKFDGADWCETTEDVFPVSSWSKAIIDTTADSPSLATDKSRSRRQFQSAEAGGKQIMKSECKAAEYTRNLFGSLLRSRDESGFVRPLDDAPKELSLRLIFEGESPVDSKVEKPLHVSPLKTLIPKFTFRVGKMKGSGGQGSFEAPSVTTIDSMICGDFIMPIPPCNLTQEKHTQPLALPLVHKAEELSSVAGHPHQLAECIDVTAAKSQSKKLRQVIHKPRRTGVFSPSQSDCRTLRRRSRIHVVEPLKDVVQQRIELPMHIIEKMFSSWRHVKYSQLLMFIVPIFSIESMLKASNQPESLLCHGSGSVVTADYNVAMALSKGDCCYAIERIRFSFVRRIASRIIENLGISNTLLDSPIEPELLNQSLIRPGRISSGHSFPDYNRSRIDFINPTVDIGQHRLSSVSNYKGSVRNAMAFVKCDSRSDHVVSQDIELLQGATKLAVLFSGRPDRRHRCHGRNCCGSSEHSRSRRISRSPAISDTTTTDAESFCPDAQQSRPDSVPYRYCTAVADIDSVVQSEECRQLVSGDFARTIVTHCPELIVNPNLASNESVTSDTDETCAIDGEPARYTIDNATSDFISGDSIPMQQFTKPKPSDHMRMLKERTVDDTGAAVFRSRNLGSLYTVEVPMIARSHCQQQQKPQLSSNQSQQQGVLLDALSATDGTSGGLIQTDPATLKCPCQDASSRGGMDDLTQRRSYNSHGFLSHRAAGIPGSAADNSSVLLNITC